MKIYILMISINILETHTLHTTSWLNHCMCTNNLEDKLQLQQNTLWYRLDQTPEISCTIAVGNLFPDRFKDVDSKWEAITWPDCERTKKKVVQKSA